MSRWKYYPRNYGCEIIFKCSGGESNAYLFTSTFDIFHLIGESSYTRQFHDAGVAR